jgi:ATP synthase protein I
MVRRAAGVSRERVLFCGLWGRSMSNDGKDTGRPMGEMSPEEREAFKKRAASLGSKLEAAKHKDAVAHGQPATASSEASRGAMGRGLRVSAELIGGVVAGGGLGWVLDRWLGTTPWLFILFFLLGSAAGIMNIVRIGQREKTPPAPSILDDGDDYK